MNEATSPLNEGPALDLAVFVAPAALAAVGEQLQRLRRPVATLAAGGPDEAAAWCARNTLPAVLLVDIGEQAHPLAALMALAAQSGPSCRIVALGTRHDVDLYRQLLQAGIFDYLVLPTQLNLLAEVLQRADANTPLGQHGSARAGRTTAIVGVAGGLGVSTLVAALGQWLAYTQHNPTVLVDFDRRKGDQALLLGLEADDGLSSILNASEIDPRLLQRTLLAAPVSQNDRPGLDRLQLLAQRPGPETPIEPERVLELGGALSQLFSLSLWDLPTHRPAGADEVLSQADIRIVVTELSVQGARSTHRLLGEIGDESAGQRLLLVASPTRLAGGQALDASQFQDFVGRSIDQSLPHAGTQLASSLLQGPLLPQSHPAYAHSVARLGQQLLGHSEPTRTVATSLGARLRGWWNNNGLARA